MKRFRARISTYALFLAAFALRCGFCCAADPPSLADQGSDALLKGDWNGALAKLNEALQRNPNNARAHFLRSCAKMELGMIDPAIADVTRAIELGPPKATAYSNRGALYYLKGEMVRAIADYDQAIRLAPRDAMGYNNRGSAYLKLHDSLRAIDDLSEAIRLEPKFAMAFANRGLAYLGMGSYENALKDLDESLRITRAPFPLRVRAQAYFRLRHPEKAFADLDEALRLGPVNLKPIWFAPRFVRKSGTTPAAWPIGRLSLPSHPRIRVPARPPRSLCHDPAKACPAGLQRGVWPADGPLLHAHDPRIRGWPLVSW